MRKDHQRFVEAGAKILVVARQSRTEMHKFWQEHELPYAGVPDPQGRITERYGQQWKLLRLGRMPAQFIIDCRGQIADAHYGKSMSDIPKNDEVLKKIKALPPCA